MRTRWIALFGGGAAALCLGSFTASLVWYYMTPRPTYVTGQEPFEPTGRHGPGAGQTKAMSPDEFDRHLDKSESRYGITALREQLAARAAGHVLEVAVGTGRNLALYDWDRVTAALQPRGDRSAALLRKSRYGAMPLADVPEVHSFTGVDVADDVLEVALRRVRETLPHGEEIVPAEKPDFAAMAVGGEGGVRGVSLLGARIRLLQSDAQAALPPPPAPVQYYDTVVQTFGLCSVKDPWAVLANMAAVTKPGTGRIILLEHGRGWWELVNGVLDRAAQGHFDRFGCWWNRDLETVVEQAAARVPGLEIVELERPGWFKFGTHYWVELRVRAPDEEAAKQKQKQDETGPATPGAAGGGGGDGGDGAWSWLSMGSALTTKPKDGAGGAKKD